jgi:hypothetical protein
MRLFIALSIVFFSISQAGALTCAPPEGSPKQQISEAYDKSDLVALAVHASPYRHGELLIKAVWKGNPEPKVKVKFTWADVPNRGNFVVFASKVDSGYVDEVICLHLWGQREQLLREIYGEPVKPSPARGKQKK